MFQIIRKMDEVNIFFYPMFIISSNKIEMRYLKNSFDKN